MPWPCPSCTYLNADDDNTTECAMCGKRNTDDWVEARTRKKPVKKNEPAATAPSSAQEQQVVKEGQQRKSTATTTTTTTTVAPPLPSPMMTLPAMPAALRQATLQHQQRNSSTNAWAAVGDTTSFSSHTTSIAPSATTASSSAPLLHHAGSSPQLPPVSGLSLNTSGHHHSHNLPASANVSSTTGSLPLTTAATTSSSNNNHHHQTTTDITSSSLSNAAARRDPRLGSNADEDERVATEERRKIFVGNLKRPISRQEVSTHFEKFGPVERVILNSGFGLVLMATREGAEKATQERWQALDWRNVEVFLYEKGQKGASWTRPVSALEKAPTCDVCKKDGAAERCSLCSLALCPSKTCATYCGVCDRRFCYFARHNATLLVCDTCHVPVCLFCGLNPDRTCDHCSTKFSQLFLTDARNKAQEFVRPHMSENDGAVYALVCALKGDSESSREGQLVAAIERASKCFDLKSSITARDAANRAIQELEQTWETTKRVHNLRALRRAAKQWSTDLSSSMPGTPASASSVAGGNSIATATITTATVLSGGLAGIVLSSPPPPLSAVASSRHTAAAGSINGDGVSSNGGGGSGMQPLSFLSVAASSTVSSSSSSSSSHANVAAHPPPTSFLSALSSNIPAAPAASTQQRMPASPSQPPASRPGGVSSQPLPPALAIGTSAAAQPSSEVDVLLPDSHTKDRFANTVRLAEDFLNQFDPRPKQYSDALCSSFMGFRTVGDRRPITIRGLDEYVERIELWDTILRTHPPSSNPAEPLTNNNNAQRLQGSSLDRVLAYCGEAERMLVIAKTVADFVGLGKDRLLGDLIRASRDVFRATVATGGAASGPALDVLKRAAKTARVLEGAAMHAKKLALNGLPPHACYHHHVLRYCRRGPHACPFSHSGERELIADSYGVELEALIPPLEELSAVAVGGLPNVVAPPPGMRAIEVNALSTMSTFPGQSHQQHQHQQQQQQQQQPHEQNAMAFRAAPGLGIMPQQLSNAGAPGGGFQPSVVPRPFQQQPPVAGIGASSPPLSSSSHSWDGYRVSSQPVAQQQQQQQQPQHPTPSVRSTSTPSSASWSDVAGTTSMSNSSPLGGAGYPPLAPSSRSSMSSVPPTGNDMFSTSGWGAVLQQPSSASSSGNGGGMESNFGNQAAKRTASAWDPFTGAAVVDTSSKLPHSLIGPNNNNATLGAQQQQQQQYHHQQVAGFGMMGSGGGQQHSSMSPPSSSSQPVNMQYMYSQTHDLIERLGLPGANAHAVQLVSVLQACGVRSSIYEVDLAHLHQELERSSIPQVMRLRLLAAMQEVQYKNFVAAHSSSSVPSSAGGRGGSNTAG